MPSCRCRAEAAWLRSRASPTTISRTRPTSRGFNPPAPPPTPSAGRLSGATSTHSPEPRTHPHIFREQTLDQMVGEWRTSCDRLADLLGEPCTVASVPGGDISPVVLQSAAVAGLHYLFTSEPTPVPERVGGCWVLGRYCL